LVISLAPDLVRGAHDVPLKITKSGSDSNVLKPADFYVARVAQQSSDRARLVAVINGKASLVALWLTAEGAHAALPFKHFVVLVVIDAVEPS